MRQANEGDDLVAKSDQSNDGTQAIRRAASILRHIARTPQSGATLREISEAMDLSRSTTHRILKCLVGEKLVSQSQDAKRYSIGELAAELGLAVTARRDAILIWRSVLESIAKNTGVTTYLMARSGSDCVCLDKAEGNTVVRVIPVEVGQRRPLGVGAGATALLSSLQDKECQAIISALEPHLHRFSRLSGDELREAVDMARSTGFAESWGNVVESVYGLGVVIPSNEDSTLALSIAAHRSLATEENINQWKRALKEAAASH